VADDGRFFVRTRWGRFVAYGLIGWCGEVAFTGVHDFVRTRDRRLPSRSSLWMFPIYGLLAPLYEALHDAMRDRGVPAPARAAVYGFLIMVIEYATGWGLRKAIGDAPWDYADAHWNIHGLVRPDYFPMWAAAGLALEPVHDRLAGRRSNEEELSR